MRRPTTDALVVALHLLVAGTVLVSALTGFRIAADDPEALLAVWIAPLTLSGAVQGLHILSSVTLISVAAGYLAYLVQARAFSTLRVPKGPTRAGNHRATWRKRNLRTYQVLFALLGGLAVTGVMIYTGSTRAGAMLPVSVVTLHVWFAWALVATVLFHVVAQYQFGATAGRNRFERLRHGADWLLKMLRPRLGRLLPSRATLQAHPLTVAVAGAAATLAGGGYVVVDNLAHARLELVGLAGDPAPVLDGLGDDPVWQRAPAVSVETYHGANLPAGQSAVEVQGATDGETLFLRFRWEDPTRSFTHLPLQKTADGWRLLHEQYDIEDEDIFYEDKFAVLLTTWSDIAGGVSHLGRQPLEGYPGGLSGRGLHFTTDGSIADMWQWKAVRSEPLGGLDDDSFGPPAEPKPEEVAGTKRYKGGYITDPGSIASQNNFAHEGPGGYGGEVAPSFLPADLAGLQARLGPVDLDPATSDAVPFAMLASEAVPYSSELDAAIPVGTIIPGIVLGEEGIVGDRGDVTTGAHWEDGWWTLEVARRLDTGNPADTAIRPGESVYMWVAVFDHSQTRHTRHMRPLEIRLPGPDAGAGPAT